MASKNRQKWLKVVEFAVVGTATWLDPSAGGLLFLLKLCFQILAALQPKDDPDQRENSSSPQVDAQEAIEEAAAPDGSQN